MDKILLIDAYAALHRAAISFPSNKESNVWTDSPPDIDTQFVYVYNFFRNLRPIIELFKPDKCFFVLEGHPQFRYDLYSDYKANRIVKTASKQDSKEKFLISKDIVLDLIQYLPIAICKASDYEADDVIAAFAENMQDEDVTVLTGDTDYIQLLQCGYKKFQIYDPIKKSFMTAPEYPYIAWKALRGDKSDNIKRLVSDKKASLFCTEPKEFANFLAQEEQRSNFNINKMLIEFAKVPLDQVVMMEGFLQENKLKIEFMKMKFDSITNPASWKKYIDTFKCIKL